MIRIQSTDYAFPLCFCFFFFVAVQFSTKHFGRWLDWVKQQWLVEVKRYTQYSASVHVLWRNEKRNVFTKIQAALKRNLLLFHIRKKDKNQKSLVNYISFVILIHFQLCMWIFIFIIITKMFTFVCYTFSDRARKRERRTDPK